MHRSQLAGFIVDCEGADPDEAAAFWGAALGFKALPQTDPNDTEYRALETKPDDLYVEVQRVNHPSRVHIDIESDDIEAEVRRLEALGAKRLGAIKAWVVMQAPTGQRFCIVEPRRANFEENANQW